MERTAAAEGVGGALVAVAVVADRVEVVIEAANPRPPGVL
eukprot:COSAG06_NODE_30250_length_542_cov_0.805869_2_plen_39_part_01